MYCDMKEGAEWEPVDMKTGYIYLYIHVLKEEGTRIAREECEDGAINIYIYIHMY